MFNNIDNLWHRISNMYPIVFCIVFNTYAVCVYIGNVKIRLCVDNNMLNISTDPSTNLVY